jgi:hypothetical protein
MALALLARPHALDDQKHMKSLARRGSIFATLHLQKNP